MAKGECPSCNTPNDYSHAACCMCGTRLPWAATVPGAPPPPPPLMPSLYPRVDGPDQITWLLSFFLPIIGLILYFVWHDQAPQRAQSAGKGAIWGFAAGFGIWLFFVIVVVGMGSRAQPGFMPMTSVSPFMPH